MNENNATINYVGKTFFSVVNPKSLENLAIPNITADLQTLAELEKDTTEKGKMLYKTTAETVGTKIYQSLADATTSEAIYISFCRSAEGLYHVHVVSSYKGTKRRTAVSKELGNAHVEDMRGSKEEAVNYIEKRGKWEEKGEVILGTYGNKNAIKENKGQRNDILGAFEELDKAVLSPEFNFNTYMLQHAYTPMLERAVEKRYERLDKLESYKSRNINVIFVEGEGGSGKSEYPYIREGACVQNADGTFATTPSGQIIYNSNASKFFKATANKKTNFILDGYNGEEILILEELRPSTINYSLLFSFLEGKPCKVDIKGGRTYAKWHTVYICTAYPLDKWWTKASEDTEDEGLEKIRKQFDRRIMEHVKMDKCKVVYHSVKTTQRAEDKRKVVVDMARNNNDLTKTANMYAEAVKCGSRADNDKARLCFCNSLGYNEIQIAMFNRLVDNAILIPID